MSEQFIFVLTACEDVCVHVYVLDICQSQIIQKPLMGFYGDMYPDSIFDLSVSATNMEIILLMVEISKQF